MTDVQNKTCKQCGETKSIDAFVAGRYKCKSCRSQNENIRQKKSKQANLAVPTPPSDLPVIDDSEISDKRVRTPLTVTPAKSRKSIKAESFRDRDELDSYVKTEIQESLDHLNDLILNNTLLVKAAYADGNSKVIDEAVKALQRAVEAKAGIVTSLMDKLKLLDELRAKTEKAKLVSFTFVSLSPDKLPQISQSREAPQ